MTSDDTNPPPLPPMRPLNEPDGPLTYRLLIQYDRVTPPRNFPGNYLDLVPRPGETWIREEDAADGQRVEIRVFCPRCKNYRASFVRRTAGDWFDNPTVLESHADDPMLRAAPRGERKAHIRCSARDCGTVDVQISRDRIADDLAALVKVVGPGGRAVLRWDQVQGRRNK